MAEMTKRERVESAMNFQETDRVPVYDLLRNDAVIEHYAGEKPVPGDLRIVGKAISLALDMTRSVRGPAEPGGYTTPEGFTYGTRRWTTWLEGRPFSDLTGLKEYAKKRIAALDASRPDREYGEHFRRSFLDLQALCGDTVILFTQSPVGLDQAFHDAGYELFCYLMVDDPGLVTEWLEALLQAELRRIHTIADVSLSPCVLTYADIAMKEKLLFSPAFLRREFFPRLKQINDAWHEHGLKCLFHSDGYLMEVMDDLVEAGCDGLNPIEILAGMDLAECKRLYGDKLFFAGGIDVSQLLPLGTPEQVRQACEEAIAIAGEGSGYFIGSTTELHNEVPVENFMAMVETAHSRRLTARK